MASLGNGDVSERECGYFLDGGVRRDVVCVHFGHILEFITTGIPIISLLTKFRNRVPFSSRRIPVVGQSPGCQKRGKRHHESVQR
jgi:hypothetical protein